MISNRSRPWSHAPLRLALACAAYAACSGGKGGNGGDGIAFADFDAAYRAAVCHYRVLCEEMPDQATCVASTNYNVGVGTSLLPTMQADLAAGLVAYDAQAARACVDLFNSIRSCTQVEVAQALGHFEDTCRAVFSGTLPPGGGCFFDEECSGRDDCSPSGCTTQECCQGTCFATPAPYPAGGDCSQMPQGWSCAAGTTCDTTTLGRIPAHRSSRPGRTAGARGTPARLPTSARLLPGNRSVCTAPVERGQGCGTTGDVFFCNDLRDYCDGSCKASIPVGGACPSGGCVGYANCVGSICVAQVGPGAGCGTTDDCLGQLVCDATLHCTLPPPGPSCR